MAPVGFLSGDSVDSFKKSPKGMLWKKGQPNEKTQKGYGKALMAMG